MKWGSPFLFNVPGGQIDQFEQCHIVGERPLGLGHLAYLAMEALHGIGGVDDLSDGIGILKVL